MICITSGGGSGLPCDSGSQIHYKDTNFLIKTNDYGRRNHNDLVNQRK